MEPIFSVKTRSFPLKTAFEIAAFLQNALNATRLSFHSIMPGTVFGPHPKITKMDIARFAFKLFIYIYIYIIIFLHVSESQRIKQYCPLMAYQITCLPCFILLKSFLYFFPGCAKIRLVTVIGWSSYFLRLVLVLVFTA